MPETRDNKPAERTVSLVLGSGGARGLAHIGVIREIEESGLRIASISGCSIGAMVGGIYAAGRLNEFEDWVLAIRGADVVRLLDIAWKKDGLVKGDRVMDTLAGLVGEQQIEDLDIPFTAVAADLTRQKEVWLNSGSLFTAIRASISLPFLLTPVTHNDSVLVDGGVLNPVPIAPTLNDRTDHTLAVNLGGIPVENPKRTESKPESSDEAGLTRLSGKVAEFVNELGKLMSDDDSGWDMYEVGNQSFDVMQNAIARHQLAVYPPDEIIEIPRNACGTLEFNRARR